MRPGLPFGVDAHRKHGRRPQDPDGDRIRSGHCLRIVPAETMAQLAVMDANNSITAAVFSAFVKCPTKAHLLAIGASPPGTFFADVEARISSMYKAVAKRRLHVGAEEADPLEFGQLWRSPDYKTITHDVDCETAVYDFSLPPHRPGSGQPRKSKLSRTFVPVLLLPRDKLDVSDSLIVCFGALALSQATGMLADTGTLIYGEGHRRKTLKIGNHVVRTRQIIEAIGATCLGREPPPLVLNRHCAVCDFQPGVAASRQNVTI